MPRPFRLGLIVNPIAGLGGRVGLKGTDGLAEQARALGAEPVAEARTLRTLARLGVPRSEIAFTTVPGSMGQSALAKAGWLTRLLDIAIGDATSAAHTLAAARAMQDDVDLIAFAGGDGTARDIVSAIGGQVPILGIPAGVKMQSAVFATTPETAGDSIAAIAALPDRAKLQYRDAEVMDLDEDALREGAIAPRLFGYAKVPHLPRMLQNAKLRNHGLDESALIAAARQLAEGMNPAFVYAIGPGHSAKRVLEALRLEGTLLGTDLVRGGKLLARDANERAILASGEQLRIIVGVIGGQGYVFGRGNQELSPIVIRRAGRDGITIIASQQKLLALEDHRLLIDTGDPELDRELAGYWRVVVGPQEDMVMRIDGPES